MDNKNMMKPLALFAIVFFMCQTAYAAIAFDATATGSSASASSLTFNHTISGSNTILVVYTMHASNTNCTTPNVTGITYNSVALTKVTQACKGIFMMEAWYLIAPTTGTNSLVVTFSGTVTDALAVSVSYTGAKQSGQPDSSATKSGTPAASPWTQSITTVLDNTLVVTGGFDSYGVADMSPDTGQTERSEQASITTNLNISDELAVTAGSTVGGISIAATFQDAILILVGIAPASATSIKTIDDLAKASVKTVNGLAIASVKTVDGLA